MYLIRSTIKSWDKIENKAQSLEEARILAKWNFRKGYEIWETIPSTMVEKYEHFCMFCRKCSTCNHLFSEHWEDDKNKTYPCGEKKCKCRVYQKWQDLTKDSIDLMK